MSSFEDRLKLASSVVQGASLYFITGAPGSGKTTLFGTLSDIPEYHGRIMMLNCGGGLRAISDRDDIAVYDVDKWSILEEARKYLDNDKHPYQWVSVDLATEAYGICLAEVVSDGSATKAGRATLEARGIANDRFVSMVRNFRVLSERRNINIVFTSHTQETKDDESGIIIVRPNLTPGTLSTVLGTVDVAMFLDIKKGKRLAYLVGTDRVWAKVRKPISQGVVPDVLENPTFEKILRIVEGREEVMSK